MPGSVWSGWDSSHQINSFSNCFPLSHKQNSFLHFLNEVIKTMWNRSRGSERLFHSRPPLPPPVPTQLFRDLQATFVVCCYLNKGVISERCAAFADKLNVFPKVTEQRRTSKSLLVNRKFGFERFLKWPGSGRVWPPPVSSCINLLNFELWTVCSTHYKVVLYFNVLEVFSSINHSEMFV